jgi:hypothetical protein
MKDHPAGDTHGHIYVYFFEYCIHAQIHNIFMFVEFVILFRRNENNNNETTQISTKHI